MENLSILLVEDHRQLAQSVLEFLEQEGAMVDYASDTTLARSLVQEHHYDILILDVMLPGEDGYTFCQALRKDMAKSMPVIFMTARDQLDDKLEGFARGGDDYIVKPFALPELVARVRALVRRERREVAANLLTVADLELDPARQEVRRDGQLLKLSPTAFRILRILMRESPKVVSREQLEQELWGDLVPDSDALRSHLYNLRKAVDKPFETSLLETQPGVGFSIRAPRE
ncbi:response regulator transcription factor [Alloalcanivorax profundimaris]|uniref:response regulator transcription factor n=1 Tax=Alloalcanivorax profundimaris TaxID=2735259 RepID=UPI000C6BFA81|nr:response regulator transcription factor [Alloalcanivorax profundimaris]MAO61132.1 DNA-binding response regulator [Alcanivorax sp.]MAY10605.1 DNA-binding response regulator [Alcanivorax sp.]MBF1803655.1 response regulator transcription factor [Alloalcanivorax profundimaris]MBI53484.1 DNA-binding response regulator [Alcanivorax sp.]MBU57978.1 DNA-binding response regulator [Alcanivorax sp.]|tara:strand:+ start:494 stop:1183 length:690 start_codon:yes stop_codon:yes gene_type:complete